ncbi:intraflagellar transport protein 46 homolog isoform X2 [Thalassophryne amazonica]|uniref:intraflagellar transport protein 46 homolog isoform X2 n=1 Tax=Thalassophryne amazonica TaxID=390379 RepID=UPI0014710E2A|nr:intraflagellar transport protein 46 homolog isoform X2 [Thalassophryne amazonica]
MERADQLRGTRLVKNQPYDESLDIVDSEEVASIYSPTPRSQYQAESRKMGMKGRGIMSANSSSDESGSTPKKAKDATCGHAGASPKEEEDEEDDSDEEETDDDDDDDDEPSEAPEGAYDPAEYTNLPVSTEIKDLFQYITRYNPQSIDLEHSLKPFIPDFIPAVGDIDAFLKVPRPDGKADSLGLVVLDEPSVKQSDPRVLSLWLSEETKQHGPTEAKVTSVASPQMDMRAVDDWVESIGALHRSKPPPSVHYVRPMPDIDSLMQEWPAEMEQALERLRLPPARLDCSLTQYADLVCSLLDIPVYGSRIQSLHLLFCLYLDSQHIARRE